MALATLGMMVTAVHAEFLLEYTGSDPCDPKAAFAQSHHYNVYGMLPNGSPGNMIGWYTIGCDGVGFFTANTTRVTAEARSFDGLMRSDLGRTYTNTLQQAYSTFGAGVSLRALTESEAAIANARRARAKGAPSIK